VAGAHRHADVVVSELAVGEDASGPAGDPADASGNAIAGMASSSRTMARAEFFQTVRLILAVARQGVGDDTRVADEPVRFFVADGMRHPDTEIVALDRPGPDDPVAMRVGFIGLTGPMGVLPDHYSDLVVARRRARDEAMGRFLDLFNHRTIALFYRAWSKYRLPVRFEEDGGALNDPFSRTLAALAGIAKMGDDPRILAAAGPLSRRVRSAGALRRMVAAMFAMPIEVIELAPRWIRIGEDEQTRLASAADPHGAFAQLGVSAVVGASTCDVAGRFRLRVGPLDGATFRSFFEREGVRRRLVEAVRFAVGPSVDFDIQLVLHRDAVTRPRLGETTMVSRDGWMIAAAAAHDRDEAVIAGRWTGAVAA
jgi:type VI secretion system protein ImpH